MLDLRKQLALSHAVASQLIGHDHARYILKTLQQPSEESLSGFGIPAWLNEDVERDAILIHGAPKITLHAPEPDEYLIEVPFVPRAADGGGAVMKTVNVMLPELSG
jgi:hypothetical protein